MAAGQQKKRLISSSLNEHFRGKKKKKLDSSDYVLSLRSQIYLEWNDSQENAVAKSEQIGVSWADMAPFVDSVPQRYSGVADVLCIPQEIYSLDNLMEVLSYEVWATCLSEPERKLLNQFLPSGTGAKKAVQSLLSGENHHFGNPFLRWSNLLCFGNLHPDAVVRREHKIRSTKKQYYSDLNKYHTDMLEGLKIWKDRWARCDDPEKLWRKALIKPKERTLPTSERVKATPHKIDICNNDTTKYISYIKISKTQLEAIKNLKHPGDGIQSKILSRVLGDINSFTVHTYEALEMEEKARLHEHWLQIVKKDIPMASEARKIIKMQQEKLKKCLEQELSDKRALITNKIDTENPEILSHEVEGGESEHDPADILDEDDVVSSSTSSDLGNQLEDIPCLDSHQELSSTESDEEVVDRVTLTVGDNSPVTSQFSGKENVVEDHVEQKSAGSPVKNVWLAVDGAKYYSSDSSLQKSEPMEEGRAPIIDLERDVQQESGQGYDGSLFSLYASQRHNNLLPPFAKGTECLSSYPSHEHLNQLKQPEPRFLTANGSLSEIVQFPHQLHEQQNLLEQSHARERDHLYMRQMMNKSLYPNGKYSAQQDLYCSTNCELTECNWIPDDQRTHNDYWSGVESSSSAAQCLGDGNSDGSLFSVLSSCRNMPSEAQCNTTNSEQMMETRNFGHNSDSVYGYVPHQFRGSSSREATTVGTAALRVAWLNYQPHHNSGLQDAIGKPFVRSWNQ